ncbi:MAG: sulfatase-like hydrolase/transferase, partial [Verrucomicrobia bacterium]|nr:sulfatase-like hydrolase/transferase [Verrucomicrobiota bacterium]
GFDVSDPDGRGGPVKNYYGKVGVTETLSEGTVKFIKESKDGPFFVYLCYWDVHSPLRAHDHVTAKYDKKLANGDWDRKWNTTYAAMIEAVDKGVGQIRQAVKDAGLVEDTLIVFTSDNGGASFATWCDPLKGAKGAFYEGGIRVANCMSWPGVIKAGSVCDTPITGVDYMPSFAELGGARLPANQPVDGQSFVPLIQGEKARGNRSIFWHYPLYLQGSDYNQIVNVYGTDKPYWRATPCSVIRKGDWKLIQFFETNSIKLFNLKKDIGESNDLAKANPKKAASMLKELQAWQKRTDAVIPTKLNPDFNPG